MVGLADMSSVSRENIEVMDALIGNFTLYDDVNKVYDIMQGKEAPLPRHAWRGMRA